jgi:hypothetical protein
MMPGATILKAAFTILLLPARDNLTLKTRMVLMPSWQQSGKLINKYQPGN